MLTKVIPQDKPKPGKDEKAPYFRLCSRGCVNCDTKRSKPCSKK